MFFETLLIIIIVIFALGPLFRRWLGPLLSRWMMGKFEDRMRRMAGMPTRKEEKKARKKARSRRRGGHPGRARVADEWEDAVRSRRPNPADFMRSYAEDVEFEEIKIDKVEIKEETKGKEDKK